MQASPALIQQTQQRLAQHYLKKLQQANTAITQTGSSNRTYWIHTVQQDWSQITKWRDWSASAQAAELDRARLCVEFCITTSAATTTQETTVETINKLRQGVQAARLLQDRAAEGEILYMLGLNHLRLQQHDAARSCADDLAACGETLQDAQMQGRAWYLRASVSFSTGKFKEAEEQHTRSRALLETNHPKDMIAVYAGLGHIMFFQGNYEASRAYHHQSRELAIRFDETANEAVAHLSLAGVCLQLNELTEAAYHAEGTLRIARKLNYLPMIPHALTMLASVKRRLGLLDEARAYYEEVLGITRATLSLDSIISVMMGLGRVYALQGDDESALTYFLDGLTMAQQHNIAIRIPPLAEELVHLYLRRDEPALARERLSDLITSAQATKADRVYAKALFAAAALWHAEGQSEQAASWINLLQQHKQHLNSEKLEKLAGSLRVTLGDDLYTQIITAEPAIDMKEIVDNLQQV